ncbi:MAG: nucleotidyl transferase AbiEii/AbiGii toxin family protein [bacterium]
MIPTANILAWRSEHPWNSNAQVEQDLIITRAIIELFSNPLIREHLAFRGGTALHKLFLTPASRYSEDIDLVQMQAGAIGPIIDAIRQCLDSWLGTPKRERSQGRITLTYRIDSEMPPVVPLKLKVEINTREHFTVLGLVTKTLISHSPWFSGKADIPSFILDELLATKLRALYQRRKGRDLFDLWLGITQGRADAKNIVDIFHQYLSHENLRVSKAEFEQNLNAKMTISGFLNDLAPLLRPGVSYDIKTAYEFIKSKIIKKM